ncbi:hypothetical protein P9265_14820 [Schinkia azotoformans]|uniref:hypothetical protein n=1 Tax=Schinkia azotoformans TaxID=1454 RepID=UPI002E20F49D|nr:hypothetical protein [Schinkia azotoformans]
MNFVVIPSFQFINDMKYFVKKKKFIKLKSDIEKFKEDLEHGDFKGVMLFEISNDEEVYKARMRNASINIGQSGGFRIIYYVDHLHKKVIILTIYSKSEKNSIENHEIIELIKRYFRTVKNS